MHWRYSELGLKEEFFLTTVIPWMDHPKYPKIKICRTMQGSILVYSEKKTCTSNPY